MGAGAGVGGEVAIKDSTSWPAGELQRGNLGNAWARRFAGLYFVKGV